MATLDHFIEVASNFADVADFLIVYIAEAHATDEWIVNGNKYRINRHKKIEERLAAASILKEKNPPCPIVVDTMSNDANHKYAAYPERLYIVHNGFIAYQGAEGPFGYDVKEVETWLHNCRQE
ncbi:hypothetical protein ACJMK2_022851 [Sinanodonta woodiana]|uniref:Iodothyronine deiodinase n=1 Tax=Sinanodonta woodiana TaxID=1069815 RepID=A0ABD3TKA2_SINWO